MKIYFAHNAPWQEREKFILSKIDKRLWSFFYILQNNYNVIKVIIDFKKGEI